MRKLAILTLLHPTVDACSIAVFVHLGADLAHAIVYNALAFALQFPLGLLLDCHPCCRRRSFLAGMVLLAGGMLSLPLVRLGWLSLGLVGIGNALFHVTAGMDVLEDHDGKAGAVALFISTGALGLLAGRALSVRFPVPFWLSLASVLGVLTLLALRQGIGEGRKAVDRDRAGPLAPLVRGAVLAALAALVAWRSWAGLVAAARTTEHALPFALAAAGAIWSGKVVGGWSGDRMGTCLTGIW